MASRRSSSHCPNCSARNQSTLIAGVLCLVRTVVAVVLHELLR
ncbi:hypothetical protein [Paenarthrobacter nitroguajacolicus]|nr:hypothetical protein [Paenarthrobacter nitroguajacolicus]